MASWVPWVYAILIVAFVFNVSCMSNEGFHTNPCMQNEWARGSAMSFPLEPKTWNLSCPHSATSEPSCSATRKATCKATRKATRTPTPKATCTAGPTKKPCPKGHKVCKCATQCNTWKQRVINAQHVRPWGNFMWDDQPQPYKGGCQGSA